MWLVWMLSICLKQCTCSWSEVCAWIALFYKLINTKSKHNLRWSLPFPHDRNWATGAQHCLSWIFLCHFTDMQIVEPKAMAPWHANVSTMHCHHAGSQPSTMTHPCWEGWSILCPSLLSPHRPSGTNLWALWPHQQNAKHVGCAQPTIRVCSPAPAWARRHTAAQQGHPEQLLSHNLVLRSLIPHSSCTWDSKAVLVLFSCLFKYIFSPKLPFHKIKSICFQLFSTRLQI